MKTIITHRRPHLDDLCAAWLLRSYRAELASAPLRFVTTTPTGGDVHDSDKELCVGIGRGAFDEHKGDSGQSAASLVFAALLQEGKIPEADREALARLIEWTRLEDTGRLTMLPYREFSVPVLLQAVHDDEQAAALGFSLLGAALASAKNLLQLERDWQERTPFLSRFGPAVAFVTDAAEAGPFAYGQGFDLMASINRAGTRHNIRAKAGTSIDLTPVHQALTAREPEAWWYLHHSKKLLICGGEIAPDAVASKCSLADLLALLQ